MSTEKGRKMPKRNKGRKDYSFSCRILALLLLRRLLGPTGKLNLKASVVPDPPGDHEASFFDQLDAEAADDLKIC